MKPEKKKERDGEQAFNAIGVPTEWIGVLYKMGINKVADLKGLNPNKLFQDLCGQNKKLKLGLTNPAQDLVKQWTE